MRSRRQCIVLRSRSRHRGSGTKQHRAARRACARVPSGSQRRDALRRRSAAPRWTTASRPRAQPAGGASSGSGAGVEVRSRPRLTSSSRSPRVRVEEAQQQRLGAEHRAVRRRRPGARKHRVVAPQRAAGRGAARRPAALRSRSREIELAARERRRVVRRRRSAATAAVVGQAGELREELARARRDRLGQLRLVVGEDRGTASTTRTPGPGTASACRAQQQQRRHRAVAAGRRAAGAGAARRASWRPGRGSRGRSRTLRRQVERRRAAPLASARRTLALEQEAVLRAPR